jgi:predicted metal-dependent phosphotriesterase family hydrolase
VIVTLTGGHLDGQMHDVDGWVAVINAPVMLECDGIGMAKYAVVGTRAEYVGTSPCPAGCGDSE